MYIKKHIIKIKEGEEEYVGFQSYEKFTDERFWSTPPVPILTVFTVWPKIEPCSDFQTRNLVFVTEQPSSVGVVRASRFESSAVEPR